MKTNAVILSLILFILATKLSSAQCPPGRYYDNTFSVKSNVNIQYGGNTKFDGTYQNLYLNVYEPDNDTFTKRPLIIFAFGGSFTFGSRTSPDILKLCNEFAKKGYVTATIDYRLGFENGNDSDTNQFKALMRAAQDMRASIRFFYKDASTLNKYKIDTNQIFIGGVSAGGFTALNLAYGKADTLSRPRPPFVDQALIDVGGITGNSGNPGYSEKVKGVINLAGAIGDTVWLMPGDPVLCGVHGTADNLVPCYFDSAKAATSVEAQMFGSGDLMNRANQIGIPNSFYFFKGAGHVPFVFNQAYMDTTFWLIRDFLIQHVQCNNNLTAISTHSAQEELFKMYPNPAKDKLVITTNSNYPLYLDVYSIEGKKLMEQKIDYPTNEIDLNSIDKGLVLIRVRNLNGYINHKQMLMIERN